MRYRTIISLVVYASHGLEYNMVNENRSNDVVTTLDRILRERLDQYNIPTEVRIELRKEIFAFFQKPERKPFGACVMTPEASLAADEAKKQKKVQRGGSTPEII